MREVKIGFFEQIYQNTDNNLVEVHIAERRCTSYNFLILFVYKIYKIK